MNVCECFLCLSVPVINFCFVLGPQEGRTYVGREDASTEQDISE